MKFTEGKSLFEAAWTQTSSWSARTHDGLFKSLSSVPQDTRLSAFRAGCIASGGKLWEIHSFANKYFGIISTEKRLTVVVEGQAHHNLSMLVDDHVTAIALHQRANLFHIFVGQHSGKVLHTILNPSGSDFTLEAMTFDLPVADGEVRGVVPQSFSGRHCPEQFWTVTDTSITLHQYVRPYVKALVIYNAPSGDLLNIEHQDPLLALHYVAKGSSSVTSVLLHTFASSFYAEVSIFMLICYFYDYLQLPIGWMIY